MERVKVDSEEKSKEANPPMFALPRVVLWLIAIIWLVQTVIYFIPSEVNLNNIALWFGFIPIRLVAPAEFPGGWLPITWTIFTHALLHAGWEHLFINTAWLAIFGTPVARRYGARPFLIVFFVSAAAGALFFALVTLPELSLLVGASGGISGLTGVAMRFVFQPVEVAKHPETGEVVVLGRRLASLREMMADVRARTFILVWIAFNALVPILPSLFNIGEMNIAWQAHLGGFFAGLLIAPLFERRPG